MKILHVIPYYVPAYVYGGPVKSTHELCRSLCAKGIENLVLTTNAGLEGDLNIALGSINNMDGVNVIYSRRGFPKWYYYSRGLSEALADNINRFDLVHIHSVYLYPVLIAVRIARSVHKPYIINPLGAFDRRLISYRSTLRKLIYINIIEKRNMQMASLIHTSSEHEKEAVLSMGIKTPIAVIPRGINLEDYKKPEGIKSLAERFPELQNKKVILFLGRIDPQKGVDLLLRAFQQVSGKSDNAYLVFVGPSRTGYLHKLTGACLNMGISERVIFCGPLYGAEKIAALYSADVFVLPSIKESFGISVLEAMAVGLPVVVTQGVGIAPDVRKAGCGMVVEYSVEAVSNALLELLGNDLKRNDAGQKARRLTEEKFLWENMSSQMIASYKSILK